MYDIFVIGNNLNWKKIKSKYPFAKKAISFTEAKSKALTPMFWAVWDDINVREDFDFTVSVPKWDEDYVHVWKNKEYFDGLSLVPRNKHISDREIKYRFFTDKKEVDQVASEPKKYDVFEIETYEQYLDAMEKSTTDMFWMTSPNLKIDDNFDFNLYITHHNAYERQENHAFVHLVNGEKFYNGVFLLSKHKPVSKKEIEHRYIIERKEWDIVASGPCQYDKFVVDTYEQYLDAKSKSRTEMFWVARSDVSILDDFKFDLYFDHSNVYDRSITHVFKNSEFYDGVMLIPKNKEISQREFDYGSIIDRKEHDVLSSLPKKFDQFNISSYEDYLNACEHSTTGMFWCVWPDVEVVEDFDFDYYVPKYNQHITYIFRNDKHFDGVCLFSKYSRVSEKEFKYRFFSEKKEIDYILSYPKKFDIFEIETYEQYLEAMKKSTTDMFWMTSPNLTVAKDFNFDLYITHHNVYERQENHAFVHLVNGEKLYNGIFLLSRNKLVTANEINHRYIVDRKEWDIVASGPGRYDVFTVDNYEQYLEAVKTSKTEMFYIVPSDINLVEDFKFDVYFSHDKKFERETHHAYLNGVFYDGIFLVSKYSEISKKEIEGKFVTQRIEEDTVASTPVKFDVFYINTYQEYLNACEQSTSNMFWAIWPDVEVVDDFDFEYYVPRYNQHITHVFKNGGHFDGVCLFNKQITVNEREFKYRFFSEKKEIDYVISYPKKYDKFIVDNYEQYLEAVKKSTTDMFYMVPSDVNVLDDFKYDIYFSHHDTVRRQENHALLNGDYYDGIFLVSKYTEISQKEIENKFIVERKEEEILASTPVKFDVCYISSYTDYLDACEKSTSSMFWCIWPDVELVEDFDFNYYVPRYNQHITHVFKNGEHFDGICLFSKNHLVTEKEFKYRFFAEKKEIDYVISYPKKYDKFIVNSYSDYLKAKEESTTDMFYMIPSDVVIDQNFKFNVYFSHHSVIERNENHAYLNGEHYDGIFLVSKYTEISQKEIDSKFIIDRKEEEVVASTPVKFDVYYINSYQDYLDATETSTTNMFWCVWPDVEVVEDFNFDYYAPRYNQHITHIFKNGQYFDGICLFSKNTIVSEKEFKYRFFNEKKEIDYVISYPKKYDVFEIDTYDQYLKAIETSTTDMFWMTSPNLKVADEFDFNVQCSRYENHAFVHLVNGEKLYNGIFLLSKHKPVTKKEIDYRYIIERKEWDIIASGPCQYEKFTVNNYDDYLHAMETSRTEMFYMIPSDVDIMPDFKFDIYYSHDKEFERNTHHGLINGGFYDGIFLVSKYKEISKKEIDGKFVVERKEEEILASRPVKFDKFEITSYKDYLDAREHSTTNMFWCVWSDVTVVEDFEFDYYVPRYNQHITHIFKNDKYFDGICLFNKNATVSEKEFNYRFFTEKKEVDYVISYPKKYDIFKINSYKQYLEAMESSKTEMFWMVPDEVEVLPNFKFDVYFSYHNTYERRTNHSFKHMFRGEETFNGICLMSKHVPVSEKEITFRYLVERKEWDIAASKMKPYDIVFISYNESNADENFKRVKSLYPTAKRVHGVKGIHQAHIKAAEQAETENFWVVDGDAIVADDFKFDYEIPIWERDTVHVWRSQNPINNLVYGYGGVKLLPRQLTLSMDVTRPDMTTSISDKFKPVQVISNITAFNTDEFSTWKSAFRECAKLASKAIDRQVDAETEERLNVWCTEGADKPYGEFAIKGALAGRKFSLENPENLFKINDFDWLHEQFLNEKNSSK